MVLQNSGKYRAQRPEQSEQPQTSETGQVFRYEIIQFFFLWICNFRTFLEKKVRSTGYAKY